jgi:hypothetical protein
MDRMTVPGSLLPALTGRSFPTVSVSARISSLPICRAMRKASSLPRIVSLRPGKTGLGSWGGRITSSRSPAKGWTWRRFGRGSDESPGSGTQSSPPFPSPERGRHRSPRWWQAICPPANSGRPSDQWTNSTVVREGSGSSRPSPFCRTERSTANVSIGSSLPPACPERRMSLRLHPLFPIPRNREGRLDPFGYSLTRVVNSRCTPSGKTTN